MGLRDEKTNPFGTPPMLTYSINHQKGQSLSILQDLIKCIDLSSLAYDMMARLHLLLLGSALIVWRLGSTSKVRYYFMYVTVLNSIWGTQPIKFLCMDFWSLQLAQKGARVRESMADGTWSP